MYNTLLTHGRQLHIGNDIILNYIHNVVFMFSTSEVVRTFSTHNDVVLG